MHNIHLTTYFNRKISTKYRVWKNCLLKFLFHNHIQYVSVLDLTEREKVCMEKYFFSMLYTLFYPKLSSETSFIFGWCQRQAKMQIWEMVLNNIVFSFGLQADSFYIVRGEFFFYSEEDKTCTKVLYLEDCGMNDLLEHFFILRFAQLCSTADLFKVISCLKTIFCAMHSLSHIHDECAYTSYGSQLANENGTHTVKTTIIGLLSSIKPFS